MGKLDRLRVRRVSGMCFLCCRLALSMKLTRRLGVRSLAIAAADLDFKLGRYTVVFNNGCVLMLII